MDIVNAYEQLGSYRAAAQLCGTTHKTVRRLIERRSAGEEVMQYRPRPKATDPYLALIEAKVRSTDGRISAKRLLPQAQAAGYTGSARSFRRAVAEVKALHRKERRVYRPWVCVPGEHLVFDWGQEGEVHIFCAVLAFSRYRFVRFATNERRETTLALLAECLEEIGGVPAVLLTDRMGCLRAATVAGLVVPHPDYLRFATHYGFRPDFCEAAWSGEQGHGRALGGVCQIGSSGRPRAFPGSCPGQHVCPALVRGGQCETPHRDLSRARRTPAA